MELKKRKNLMSIIKARLMNLKKVGNSLLLYWFFTLSMVKSV